MVNSTWSLSTMEMAEMCPLLLNLLIPNTAVPTMPTTGSTGPPTSKVKAVIFLKRTADAVSETRPYIRSGLIIFDL